MKLQNKVALITGGSVGIGQATAELFAREGAKVVVNGVSSRGRKVAQSICDAGGEAVFAQGAVENPDDCEKIVAAAMDHFGRLDILFNNAGIVLPGRIEDMSVEDIDRLLAVNVRGVLLMSKIAVTQMKIQGYGVIIHNASVAAVKGLKDRAVYTATKGAVMALTKAMAVDYIRENIRVNCINPGTTLTPSLQDRINEFNDPVAAKQMFADRQPMARLGDPMEIAAGVLYLASNEASFVTGQTLNIDGGLTV